MDKQERQKKRTLPEFAVFAVEAMSDGVYLIARDATIAYVNRAACEQLGYTEQEMLALRIFDINPHLTQEIWDSVWGVTVADKVQTLEIEHRTKDGRLVPYEVLANFIEIDGVQYSCSFTRDLTKRREMETRIRQSEKMEAIGHLAGGIAHDFNNQLSGILGNAELLRHELKNAPDLAECADDIITGVQRSAELIAQLLAFARKGKYLSEAVDVRALVDETQKLLAHSINKNIRVTVRHGAERAVVSGDPSQLETVLLNLAVNARDAMPAGGELVYETDMVDVNEAECRRSGFDLKPGVHVRIKVADTGVGMSDDIVRRLSEPFFTTKENGTGMGMASVFGIVRNHRGAVRVTSALGRGTTVTLLFPAGDPDAPGRPTGATVSPLRITARILLVEDEPLVRETTVKILERLGCRVVPAGNGREAVALYGAIYRDIDAVILDLIMPEMGGKETFQRLREINPDIIAIVASGYSPDGDVREMLASGVREFIPKPFRSAQLALSLSRLLSDRPGMVGPQI
jgi:PAS domain S-box-containing protein